MNYLSRILDPISEFFDAADDWMGNSPSRLMVVITLISVITIGFLGSVVVLLFALSYVVDCL